LSWLLCAPADAAWNNEIFRKRPVFRKKRR